jgi:hypothetical protein
MKYYSYNEYDPDPNARTIKTFSEQEILDIYYPYWKEQMIKKFGEKVFYEVYDTKESCISDWIVINWAWETDEPGNTTK